MSFDSSSSKLSPNKEQIGKTSLKNNHVPLSPRIRDAIRRISRRAILGDESKSIREKIHEELTAPHRALPRERIAFVMGVSALLITQHILLVYPKSFGMFYTILAIPLLIYRAKQYISRKWGSFLLDFCYLVNLLLLIHLWILPYNPYFFEMVFAVANGPVAWAIILWRNSLVFHSPERLTSLFIHIFPPLVTYAQRWLVYNPSSFASSSSSSSNSNSNSSFPLLPSYLSCVDPQAAKLAREALLASYKAAINAAAESAAQAAVAAIANLTTQKLQEESVQETTDTISKSSGSFFQFFGFTITPNPFYQIFDFFSSTTSSISVPISSEYMSPTLEPDISSSSSSQSSQSQLDMNDVIESSQDVLGSVVGTVIDIPFFGEIGLQEFEKNVYPEDIATSLFTTCDHSYYRVLGVPLFCYLLWQISYFILTEIPLPISIMRRFCKVEIQEEEEEDNSETTSTSSTTSSSSDTLSNSNVSLSNSKNVCQRHKHYLLLQQKGLKNKRHHHHHHKRQSLFSDPEQLSSLRWMVTKARDAGLTKISLNFARYFGILKQDEEFDAESKRTKFVFALIQLLITIAGLVCSKVLYDNKLLHTLFLIMLILVAAFNGASFTLRSVDIAAAESGQAPSSSLSSSRESATITSAEQATCSAEQEDDTSDEEQRLDSEKGGEKDNEVKSSILKSNTVSPTIHDSSPSSSRLASSSLLQPLTPVRPLSLTSISPLASVSTSLTSESRDRTSPQLTSIENNVYNENDTTSQLTTEDLQQIEEKEQGQHNEIQRKIQIAKGYTSASEARRRVIEESRNWVWLERRRFFVNKQTGEQCRIFPSGIDKRFIVIDRER